MSILKGWRTRMATGLVFVVGIMEMFSPDMLSTALGLGDRGHAIFYVAFSLVFYGLRQITTTAPGKAD